VAAGLNHEYPIDSFFKKPAIRYVYSPEVSLYEIFFRGKLLIRVYIFMMRIYKLASPAFLLFLHEAKGKK